LSDFDILQLQWWYCIGNINYESHDD